VIRVPIRNAQSPSVDYEGRSAKDPKATAICGGSESIAPFGFQVGQDKVLRRTVAATGDCGGAIVLRHPFFLFEPTEGW